MFVVLTILSAFFYIAHWALSAYTWVIVVAALLSWVNPDPYNPLVRALRALTEPLFWRIRRWAPFVCVSGIDLSPVAALMAIQFFDYILASFAAQLHAGGI